MKNLFLSEEKKVKITHIISLMAVLSADGKVADEEIVLLQAIAKREGLTDDEYFDIIKGGKKVKPTIPKDEEQKIQYLKDATAMMLIDGSLDPEELKLCVAVGKRLGLSVDKVSEIMTGIIAKYSVNKMKQDLLNKQSEKPVEIDKNVAFDKQSGLKVEVVNNPGKKRLVLLSLTKRLSPWVHLPFL